MRHSFWLVGAWRPCSTALRIGCSSTSSSRGGSNVGPLAAHLALHRPSSSSSRTPLLEHDSSLQRPASRRTFSSSIRREKKQRARDASAVDDLPLAGRSPPPRPSTSSSSSRSPSSSSSSPASGQKTKWSAAQSVDRLRTDGQVKEGGWSRLAGPGRGSYVPRVREVEDVDPTAYLKGLSEEQELAAKHDPEIPLQILAGPGSGKTRVIASRITHLIKEIGYEPDQIVSVTFTNKAAREMKERLDLFLGVDKTDEIVMGTFHGVCLRFLRPHGHLIGLPSGFTIQGSEDCTRRISNILQAATGQGAKAVKELTRDFQSEISKAKSKGRTPHFLRAGEGEREKKKSKDGKLKLVASDPLAVARVYEEYQAELTRVQAVDFDDILLSGLKLFEDHGHHLLSNIRHTLIDEFQDLNIIQYRIAKCLAGSRKAITIVGDPDQSIYGWRSAEFENLDIMTSDFEGVRRVFLEQNYRSSLGILNYGLSVISQDTNRIEKSLLGMRGEHSIPVQLTVPTRDNEGPFIAKEIKRLKISLGLKWDDFAILCRYNSQSLALESALDAEEVPNLVLKGRSFFHRSEIMLVLAYLQLIDNENFGSAFERVINAPHRRVGAATLEKIRAAAHASDVSPIELIRSGQLPSGERISTVAVEACEELVAVLDELRQLAEEGEQPSTIIQQLLDKVPLEQHLEKAQNFETRWENVREMQVFTFGLQEKLEKKAATDDDEKTPLRRYLDHIALVSDSHDSKNDKSPKVTISTIHSAKGLEWPVVFIPSANEGVLPARWIETDEEIAEERRLFYVACTRAEALLYVVVPESSTGWNGKSQNLEPSPFLPPPSLPNGQRLSTKTLPRVTPETKAALAAFLKRPPPSKIQAQKFDQERNQRPKESNDVDVEAGDWGLPPGSSSRKDLLWSSGKARSINSPWKGKSVPAWQR